MITCDKYYYGEDNYGLSCFRTIAWEDLNTYDFIKYGCDESLNAIIVSVFKNLFNRNYGQAKIVDWLDSIGVECFHYHFYILEKGIDL